MNIIIRASGERTEPECIKLCSNIGNVHTIRAIPFADSIRETFFKGMDLDEKWTIVIDADVLIYPGVIEKAIHELNSRPSNIFCLDGKTDDKILRCTRRAGVHIYRTDMLEIAFPFIDSEQLKPESYIRRNMEDAGFITWSGGSLVFGRHDHEQYYRDLWRKSVCQVWKLAGMIKKKNSVACWQEFEKKDNDFKVILAAHAWGLENTKENEIRIDKNLDFNSVDNIELLGLVEKGEYCD